MALALHARWPWHYTPDGPGTDRHPTGGGWPLYPEADDSAILVLSEKKHVFSRLKSLCDGIHSWGEIVAFAGVGQHTRNREETMKNS